MVVHQYSVVNIENEAQILSTTRSALGLLLPLAYYRTVACLYSTYPTIISSHVTKLSDVANRLKGVDAFLKRECDALGLGASLKALLFDEHDTGVHCFLDDFADFGILQIERPLLGYLCECSDGGAII